MTDDSNENTSNMHSEAFYRFLETVPMPVLELHFDFTVKYANTLAEELFKIDFDSLEHPLSFLSLVASEHRSTVVEFLQQSSGRHERISLSVPLLREDFRFSVEILAIRTPSKEAAGFLVYIYDLSKSSEARIMKFEKEDMFRLIVEQSSIAGLIIVDEKLRFVYVNARFAEMLYTSPAGLLGKNFRDFLHPDDIPFAITCLQARPQKEHPAPRYDLRVIRTDGQIRTLRLSSTTMCARNGNIYSVAHLIDVTEEVKSRRLLEESERKYRTLIETSDSGIATDDANGRITMVNSALCNMLGYTKEELVGQSIKILFHKWTDEIVGERMERRRSGIFEQYEAALHTRHCNTIPAVVSASPLYDSENQFIGSLAIFTDVSEIKLAEQAVRFLLDLLMHDFGNQLQLILSGADLIDIASTSEDRERATKFIRDGIDRCLEIISKVRLAEKTRLEPLSPVDLAKVLRDEVELISRQFQVTPSISGIPDTLMISADSALFYLFRNLLENAIKHNPYEEKHIWIHGHQNGRKFIVCIADNGPGLSAEKKSSLFDPDRRYGGVGLHLVSKIARKYGSSLTVSDRIDGSPEDGLKVCITFNLQE